MSLNRFQCIGHVCQQPELGYLPSGREKCTICVAVDYDTKDKDGKVQKATSFINCDAFGLTAKNLSAWASKGRLILIEGKVKQKEWTDKGSGHNHRKTYIEVAMFQLLDKREKPTPEPSQEEDEDIPF